MKVRDTSHQQQNIIGEADKDIASFAQKTRNCVGVLGQDTDFLIYDIREYLPNSAPWCNSFSSLHSS